MIKNYLNPIFFFLFLLLIQATNGQNLQGEVLEELLDFHSVSKETAYLHLNKSVLLKGEQLGFAAYVITQKDFKPSNETTNLYVQVKDTNNVVVKEKMVLIENGTGAGYFDIDSTFAAGTYSVTAFTNWMQNFKQQYFFSEKIQVIQLNSDNQKEIIDDLQMVNVQFLPESGHLIEKAINKLGIIATDSLGYGLANASVQIINQKNEQVSKTILNKVGIGTISFTPNISDEYRALINYEGREFSKNIETKTEQKGVIISTNNKENELEIFLNTNTETINELDNAPFVLSIQSTTGAVITYQLTFNDETGIRIPVAKDNLKPGMNIITLFDADLRPVAERLFFNYKNLPIGKIEKPEILNAKDSLQITIPTKKFADSTFLSISVLPENTIADRSNHNIISYMMLQPHLQGSIEDAGWYFENINESKKEDLDKLLLTQGWSSYNWKTIFEPRDYKYDFEKHIDLIAKINDPKEKDRKFLIHASPTNPPIFIDIPEGKDSFIFEGIIPLEGENLFISRLKNNDALVPAELSVQFFPRHIKDFTLHSNSLAQKAHLYSIKQNSQSYKFNGFVNKFEELDEVLIKAKAADELTRERELGMHKWGKVDVLEDVEKSMFNTLGQYLTSKGFQVKEIPGEFKVQSGLASWGKANAGEEGVAMFLDGMPIFDKTIFYQYSLSNIDYIEINKTGMGSGLIGTNGSIKIYSDFTVSASNNPSRVRIQKIEFPLAYAVDKQFYVPKYQNTRDEFYQQYGVIDWKSKLIAGKDKNISIEIKKPEVDFKMIIEGFSATGDLFYEVKSVSVQ
jgi:hypothetical protein